MLSAALTSYIYSDSSPSTAVQFSYRIYGDLAMHYSSCEFEREKKKCAMHYSSREFSDARTKGNSIRPSAADDDIYLD